jgi:hypothetical protein
MLAQLTHPLGYMRMVGFGYVMGWVCPFSPCIGTGGYFTRFLGRIDTKSSSIGGGMTLFYIIIIIFPKDTKFNLNVYISNYKSW